MFVALIALTTGCAGDADDGSDSDADADDDAAEALDGFSGRTFEAASLPADVAPGDIVRHRAASVLVPPAGQGVTAEVLHADGSSDTIQVIVGRDGRVQVATDDAAIDTSPEPTAILPDDLDEADPSLDADAASSPPRRCRDRRHNLLGYRWITSLDFSFKAKTTPHELTRDEAEAAIRRAGVNIVDADNRCGRADHVSAKIHYLGRTQRGVNVTKDATCAAGDQHSVVAFRDLNDSLSGVLAATCTYTVAAHDHFRTAVESDIRIARTNFNWFVDGPCDPVKNPAKFSLEAVLTHERGHSFGLAHVANSKLTMNPTISACSVQPSNLGKGDMLGLEVLY